MIQAPNAYETHQVVACPKRGNRQDRPNLRLPRWRFFQLSRLGSERSQIKSYFLPTVPRQTTPRSFLGNPDGDLDFYGGHSQNVSVDSTNQLFPCHWPANPAGSMRLTPKGSTNPTLASSSAYTQSTLAGNETQSRASNS
ncbi:hypothetical protein AG1IA_04522 [Rhizoctonia solani AG-1 IA]|uniref:Uncharacterized protein n=1 Tax=Thanatephorus cucumeris (strain AG1-IA) TaxID=983506 RepID=L8WTH2_THACA|nr:hypothetical protein AG1IA_04522 [Rhizoctonia solani AG-1 IA]